MTPSVSFLPRVVSVVAVILFPELYQAVNDILHAGAR